MLTKFPLANLNWILNIFLFDFLCFLTNLLDHII